MGSAPASMEAPTTQAMAMQAPVSNNVLQAKQNMADDLEYAEN